MTPVSFLGISWARFLILTMVCGGMGGIISGSSAFAASGNAVSADIIPAPTSSPVDGVVQPASPSVSPSSASVSSMPSSAVAGDPFGGLIPAETPSSGMPAVASRIEPPSSVVITDSVPSSMPSGSPSITSSQGMSASTMPAQAIQAQDPFMLPPPPPLATKAIKPQSVQAMPVPKSDIKPTIHTENAPVISVEKGVDPLNGDLFSKSLAGFMGAGHEKTIPVSDKKTPLGIVSHETKSKPINVGLKSVPVDPVQTLKNKEIKDPKVKKIASVSSDRKVGGRKIMIDTDYMQGLKLGVSAGQLVIGNPSIADVVVRDDQYIFISGKSPGRTNLLVYGKDGTLQEQYLLAVRTANEYMSVMRGPANRSHYDCMPRCERVFRMEDSGSEAGDQSGKIGSALSLIDGRADRSKSQETSDLNPSNGAAAQQR